MNTDGPEKPIGLVSYESWAERYISVAEVSPYNRYYERPTMLALFPDVTGRRVLDAGCGAGWYCDWLVSHGAQVTGIDITPKMIEIAKQRLDNSVNLIEADLSKPLDFCEDGAFDLITSSLTLHYLEGWRGTFTEFYRILALGGRFIFSVFHPFKPSFVTREQYFETELMEEQWTTCCDPPVSIKFYRRSLTEILAPLHESGFVVEQIVEPLPIEECKREFPQVYAQLSRHPAFVCIKAVKL